MYEEIQNLLTTLKESGKHYDLEKIKQAFLYAKELHEGQFRASGEPYISHPVAVAEIVASLGLDTDSICAALLHDVVEDCGTRTDTEDLRHKFGDQVALLVDGLTKLKYIPFEDKEEAHIENLRKMFLAMSKDVCVILIKLCDRLHNMRTLGAKNEDKRRQISLETMQVYAPLAHRLGMQRIKQELENISLGYLDPVGYREVQQHIEEKFGQNRNFIENCKKSVSEKLEKSGINFQLEGRVKSVYSIYRKMYEHNKSFDEIYDFYAMRIIVQTELECYTVLGIIHDMYKSMPGRFKDYISTPKPNMYRSLHTTVIGSDGIPFEVQIRTWEMHQIAEYGICAHWKYKSGEQGSGEMDRKLTWIRKLIEDDDVKCDPDEFMRALKIDIFHDETFVFTPKGDVIALPQGATVIDFAYLIHSQVGNRMVGAKINGMIVPIDRVPANGEIVEILTSAASKGPSRDWLKIVKTSEARNKIRQWFKEERRTENIAMGRAEIDRELKRFGRAVTDGEREQILSAVCARIGMSSVEDLYNTIGFGGLTVSKLSGKLHDEFNRVVQPDETAQPVITDISQVPITQPTRRHRTASGVVVDGVDGCAVKFAKCCNPLPGDSLVGFITKGFGISVHKSDCPNVLRSRRNPEYQNRWVSAYWATAEQSPSDEFEAVVLVMAADRIGMLADITVALADMKVSIRNISSQQQGSGVLMHITIGCKNLDHFYSIMSRLRNIPDVRDVSRG